MGHSVYNEIKYIYHRFVIRKILCVGVFSLSYNLFNWLFNILFDKTIWKLSGKVLSYVYTPFPCYCHNVIWWLNCIQTLYNMTTTNNQTIWNILKPNITHKIW